MKNSKPNPLGYISGSKKHATLFKIIPNSISNESDLLKEIDALNDLLQQQTPQASKRSNPFLSSTDSLDKYHSIRPVVDIAWVTEKERISHWGEQLLVMAKGTQINVLYFNAYSLSLKIETFYIEYTSLIKDIQWLATPNQQIAPSVKLSYVALERYLYQSLEAINQFNVAFNKIKGYITLKVQKSLDSYLSQLEKHIQQLQFALLQKGKEANTIYFSSLISDFHSVQKKSPSSNLHAQKEEDFLKEVIAIIDLHLDEEKLTVEYLSQLLYISSSQLYRKILSLTNQTATQFIRTIRLDRGKTMLENGIGNVSEVAYKVGYTPSYFSRAFSKQYGYAPKVLLER